MHRELLQSIENIPHFSKSDNNQILLLKQNAFNYFEETAVNIFKSKL